MCNLKTGVQTLQAKKLFIILNLLFLILTLFNLPEAAFALNCGDEMSVFRGIAAKHNGLCHAKVTNPCCCAGYSCNYRDPYDNYGYRYQCVEYVNRFFNIVKNWQNMCNSGDARDYFINAQKNIERQAGLEYCDNGKGRPQSGDILCFDDGGLGHVAIIVNVDPFNNKVYFIEQNWDPSGISSLDLTKSGNTYLIADRGSYHVQGWLRSPYKYNPSDSSVRWHPDGTLIRAKGGVDVYLIHEGKRKKIINEDIFSSYSFDWNKVIEVEQAEIDCLPQGKI